MEQEPGNNEASSGTSAFDAGVERANFEAWYSPIFCSNETANMPRRSCGEYVSQQQQIAWMSWKARAKQQSAKRVRSNVRNERPEASAACAGSRSNDVLAGTPGGKD